MDVANTAFSITVTGSIVKFISEHSHKGLLQEQIANIVIQIQNLIKPLLHDFQDETLHHVLRSLNTVLVNVDSHLRSWAESRTQRVIALVKPWAMTQEIGEDRQQLMDHYQLLTGAMQTYDFIRGYNLLLSGNNSPSHVQPSRTVNPRGSAVPHEDEVLRFCHRRIGGDVRHFGTILLVLTAKAFTPARSRQRSSVV